MSGSVYCCFFGVTYNAGKIGLPSLQLNVIFLSVVEMVCYIISICIIAKTRRKIGSIICLSVMLFGGVLLYVSHLLWSDHEWNQYIETGVTCILVKGGLSLQYVIVYAWASEMFPSTIRGTAVGFALTMARILAAFLSGYLIKVAED